MAGPFLTISPAAFFVLFAPLADEAKGGDGAKSAFCGYSRLLFAFLAFLSRLFPVPSDN
jgi:hypothetical protein